MYYELFMNMFIVNLCAVQVVPRGITVKSLYNLLKDLSFSKSSFPKLQRQHCGEWKYGVQWRLGQDIANSTVGIIGLGGVGQAIVRRLKGFDVAKFIYSGRTDKPQAKILGVQRVPVEQLLKESDFVVLSCPLTDETRHIINDTSLKTMKKTAVLVNVGRGGLVDQKALSKALQEGTIFSAGLDVTSPEPLSKDDPIVGLPNCYIVPHLGSATIETRNLMAQLSAHNLLLALEGKPMPHPIC